MRIEQVPIQPSGAAIAGTAIHATIEISEYEEFWKDWSNFEDDGIGAGLFIDEFGRLIAEAELDGKTIRWGGRKTKEWPEGETADWWAVKGPEMLRRYALLRRADADAGMIALAENIERKVAANFTTRDGRLMLIEGYIDAVLMVTSDGEGIIRDYKSGTWIELTQNPIYAWLLAQDQKRPWTITRGQIAKLRAAKMDNMLTEYDLSPWLPLIPRLFEEAEEGIRKAIFHLNPSSFCSSCLVRASCVWGSTLATDEGDNAAS